MRCLAAAGGLLLLAIGLVTAPVHAADAPPTADADGFVPLFNGKDLSGWVPVNVAPGNTFTVKDGEIYCTGVPTGVMRTARHYENFVIELDWMHLKPGGNSGLFIWGDAITSPGVPFTRGIEVQILDDAYFDEAAKKKGFATGHGDLFAIHGATLKPDHPHPGGWMRNLPTAHTTKPAGEWNHYHVVCNNGVIKLSVNGTEVSGVSQCNPRKGYICLESEGGPIRFKNIRIKELPSTDAPPEETATVDTGFKSIYTGVDLAGWVQDEGHKDHWKAKDWILDYDGKSEAKDKNLWTDKEYGDFEMIVDWRLPNKPQKLARPVILPSGETAKNADGSEKTEMVDDAGDSGIYLRGSSKAQVNIWCWPVGSGEVYGYRTDPKMSPEVRAAVTPKVAADKKPGQWNRFVITMKSDRLTVALNGKTVIENAQLPDVPAKGRIGLQHHGDAVQFGNIYVKELK